MFLVPLLVTLLPLSLCQDDFVRVETKYGAVDGQSFLLQSGNVINAFLAIPYARPPLGDLRWREPLEPEPWTEPLDATTLGSACIQNLVNNIQITHPGMVLNFELKVAVCNTI